MRAFVALTVLVLVGCSSSARPSTASELCEQLRKGTSVVSCDTVTDRDALATWHAVEAAGLMISVFEGKGRTCEGWVVYRDGQPEAPKVDPSLMATHNERAGVSVYLRRGLVTAEQWQSISGRVKALKPLD